MADLFGRYCYINTPWIAGEKTRYRIIGSGVSSNVWCDVPLGARANRNDIHDHIEDIVFVILDTCVNDSSSILRVALQDIDLIEEEQRRGTWIVEEPLVRTYGRPRPMCERCGAFALFEQKNFDSYAVTLSNFCPDCGADMRGKNDGVNIER